MPYEMVDAQPSTGRLCGVLQGSHFSKSFSLVKIPLIIPIWGKVINVTWHLNDKIFELRSLF
mgnify:CR=1 FL=1